MSLVTWTIISMIVILIAYYATRMARNREEGYYHDTGLAIIEFGRAFPQEAIRSLHETVDGNAIFVRLHDNKAGVMRNYGHHYACHLIEPGRARATPLPNNRGFSVEFLDSPTQNGDFVFATAAVAAEVSLWLLGNYVAPGRAASGDARDDLGTTSV